MLRSNLSIANCVLPILDKGQSANVKESKADFLEKEENKK
jgi:hypothetical protein